MKIHEYQSKELFTKYSIPVPQGNVIEKKEEAEKVARDIGKKVVVKAQVHAGGRGKGGGIKLADNPAQAVEKAGEIIGMNLVTHQTGPEGKYVRKVLIEEALEVDRELYVGMVIDRDHALITSIASEEGGVEIETVAAKTPEKIIKIPISPGIGIQSFQARKIAFGLNLSPELIRDASKMILNLYTLFNECDASLVEINPLVVTKENRLLAADAKINFDDNALDRHADIKNLRDISEEEPTEVEASNYNLSYVKLDGNVG
ncbi:MAG: acetate--CoA ligase family protein, partial [bacterium]